MHGDVQFLCFESGEFGRQHPRYIVLPRPLPGVVLLLHYCRPFAAGPALSMLSTPAFILCGARSVAAVEADAAWFAC